MVVVSSAVSASSTPGGPRNAHDQRVKTRATAQAPYGTCTGNGRRPKNRSTLKTSPSSQHPSLSKWVEGKTVASHHCGCMQGRVICEPYGERDAHFQSPSRGGSAFRGASFFVAWSETGVPSSLVWRICVAWCTSSTSKGGVASTLRSGSVRFELRREEGAQRHQAPCSNSPHHIRGGRDDLHQVLGKVPTENYLFWSEHHKILCVPTTKKSAVIGGTVCAPSATAELLDASFWRPSPQKEQQHRDQMRKCHFPNASFVPRVCRGVQNNETSCRVDSVTRVGGELSVGSI